MDFDNIYEEYFDRVYYKVLSVVKNDDDAEDICQDEVLSLPEDINFDTKVILEEKLKLISEKEREIVILKDIYGYKLKEIAEIKNMNLSTVKSVYYKALKDMGGN